MNTGTGNHTVGPSGTGPCQARGESVPGQKRRITILGMNPRVSRLVEELCGEGIGEGTFDIMVLAPTRDDTLLERFPGVRSHIGSGTPEELERFDVHRSEAILVVVPEGTGGSASGMGSERVADAQTILSVLTLRKFLASHRSTARVVAEVVSDEAVEHVRNAGADEIILIGSTVASILASAVINPGITRFFDETFSTTYGHEFYIVPAPPSLADQTFLSALEGLKREHGMILVGVRRGTEVIVNPRRLIIRPDDSIIVLSRFHPDLPMEVGQ